MTRKIAFLFPGQGSHYYQMGRELYEHNPVFRSSMDRLDAPARGLLGRSVIAALYGPQGKADPFDDLRLTHPAIFMVEFALAECVMALGITPDCTLGASLGTVAALAVAQCIDPEEALALVIRQALTIEQHCPKGGMIAVMTEPALYEGSPFLKARSVIAGRNFASHFVLAAPQENLQAIDRFLARGGIARQTLAVPYPFHSPWIEPVRDRLIDACATAGVRITGTPVICCAGGGVLERLPADYFWQVARAEIGFQREIARLEQAGPFDYLDLGPSGTLATFLKYLLAGDSGSRAFSLMTPFGRDSESLASALRQLRPARRPATAEI